jgi:hypothetical protein
MGNLRSALAELRQDDVRFMSSADLEADLEDLHRALASLEAERLRRLAEFDRRNAFARNGYSSSTAWLMHRCGLDGAGGRSLVRAARSLDKMPLVRRAFVAGDLSLVKVRSLVAARERHPDAFAAAEATLLDAALALAMPQLRRALAYWRQAIDGPGVLADANNLHDRRRVFVSRTFSGMLRLDCDFDPAGGEIVATALESATTDPTTGGMSAAQRRADALVDICRAWLDSGAAPVSGGERPHVTVLADLAALQRDAGTTCESDQMGVLHPETMRRIICDSGVSRVVTRGDSEPLDIGRRTRTVPPSLRRAVVVRDRGCRFPGCDRPHQWCDAHHVRHWVQGGATALDNLILLCRHHHRLVHEGGFGLTGEAGAWVFVRPDGVHLHERPPPGPEPPPGSEPSPGADPPAHRSPVPTFVPMPPLPRARSGTSATAAV